MKKEKVFIALFVLAMVMGIGTVAQADLIQDDLDPVRFFVVDDNDDPNPGFGDDKVTLSITGNLPSGWNLEYSPDGTPSSWDDAGPSLEIATGADDWELAYFRITDGTNVDNKADLKFVSFEGELWNAVIIHWNDDHADYSSFDFVVANDDDNVAPVPIPASALLLGFGMVGLIGFGKRMRKKIL